MAPETLGSAKRWSFTLGSLSVLAIMVLILLGINWQLRGELDEAERRLSRVEVNEVAEDAAERTAEVATCYARARARPDLVAALSAIAAFIETDVAGRIALDNLIESYDDMAPKLVECRQLARHNGLDPKDFERPRDGR